MTFKSILLAVLAVICIITSASALSTSTNNKSVNRLSFLKTTCASAAAAVFTTTASPNPAFAAKEVDPAIKGTKADPKYQACLSECMYECTKPKVESKTRAECLPECKTKCATTKQQLMIGTPLKAE